jgi:CheY-like chemotaxis protein
MAGVNGRYPNTFEQKSASRILKYRAAFFSLRQIALLTDPAISVPSSDYSLTLSAHLKKVAIGSMVLCCILEANTGNAIIPRILVVDDDPLICSAIQAWLEGRSFEVLVADGSEAGLSALDGSTFDLMIVDIFMPHMHGFESIRLFHQRAPMLPLIAIFGYVFAEQRAPAPDFLRMALELGATRCLRKPFTPTALLAVVDACLLESETRRIEAIGR